MPMPVNITPTEIPAVLVLETRVVKDDRGYFSETYSREMFAKAGLVEDFLQDNLSGSKRGTVRGLHYQLSPHGMGKLVRCIKGSIFDVAVDIRRGSPTFGKWVSRTLTPENRLAMWVPIGFAHGFLALEDDTLVLYKCTAIHAPESERAINYLDETIRIAWPFEPTLVSGKDAEAPRLESAEFDFTFSGR